jgi:RNA recognition motif-containing protein
MAGRRLYVGNLPFELDNGGAMSERVLEELFAPCGKIADVILMRESGTHRLRGFAFVEFSTEQEAAEAASVLHQTMFHGRCLTVQAANPRRNDGQTRSDEDAQRRTSDRG